MAIAIPVSSNFADLKARLTAARPRRVALLLVGLWLTNLVDARLTLEAHGQGLLCELNPVASQLIDLSPTSLYAYKLLLLLFGTFLLWRCRRYRIAELAAWLMTLTYVGVCLHWQSCYNVFLSEDFSEELAALAATRF